MELNLFLENLRDKADTAPPTAPTNYIVDGLLHCGKCNTTKQCRVVISGKVCVMPCMCVCKLAEIDLERKEDARRQIEASYASYAANHGLEDIKRWFDRNNYSISDKLVEEHKNILRQLCFGSELMLDWTFANDDRRNARISTATRKYADHFADPDVKIKGLCLFGLPGTGKSYYAACIAHAVIDHGHTALMCNFNQIRNKVQESFATKQDILDQINSVDLLVIDDFGTESNTEFMSELIFSVIDARAGLPLIITTNLTANELKHACGAKAKIYSRILGMCLPIEVLGNDRRREHLADNAQGVKDIFGL